MRRLLIPLLLALVTTGPLARNKIPVVADAKHVGAKHLTHNYAQRSEVQAFIEEMHAKHGFDAAALTAMFRQTKPVAAVIKAIMPPKDPGVRSWQSYRGRFIEARRIAAGRRFMQTYAAELAAIRLASMKRPR